MLIFGNLAFGVTDTSEDYKDTYEQTLNEYLKYDEFNSHLESNKKAALEMIRNITERRLADSNSAQLRGGTMTEAYDFDVQLSIQADTYTCGYATILQTMYGLEKEHLIQGSTDEQKQRTIETDIGHYGTSVIVWEVVAYLNGYLSSDDYAYYLGSSSAMSEDDFADKVALSLMMERPVLLHAITEDLSYYNGTSQNHYLSIYYINQNTDKVKIADCNYDSQFGGYHYADLSEAYATIHDHYNRYLISY